MTLRLPAACFTLLALLPSTATAEVPQIKIDGQEIGVLEDIDISGGDNDDRTRITLTARFWNLPRDLDANLKARGNILGKCSQRLYWVGNTRITEYGPILRLTSRLRYEQWLCSSLFKTRLLRDTKTVRWSVFINPSSLADLSVHIRLDDVVNFPDDLERWFDLRIQRSIPIPIPQTCGRCPCSYITQETGPTFDSVNFAAHNDHSIATVAFSLSELSKALACIPD